MFISEITAVKSFIFMLIKCLNHLMQSSQHVKLTEFQSFDV